MYNFDHKIGLITIPTQLKQNISILLTEECLEADSLAVAHNGYINFIPLANTTRRCKYVPICAEKRGQGSVIMLKWMEIGYETFFVVLSTLGLHVFDKELSSTCFSFDFKKVLHQKLALPTAACSIEFNLLVALDNGFICIFRNDDDNLKFVQVFKPEESFLGGSFKVLESFQNNLVSVSDNCIFSYVLLESWPELVCQYLADNSSLSISKVGEDVLILGHQNGELELYEFIFKIKPMLKIKAHEKEITGLDFCPRKNLILTCSKHYSLKVWSFSRFNTMLNCLYKVKSTNKPYCGITFSNKNSKQFCAVKFSDPDVEFYEYSNIDDEDFYTCESEDE